MKNVLYLGMADDIFTPIILIPDFDTLFVVDSFDHAFARNNAWEGMKEDILEKLTRGDNKLSHHREVMLHYNKNVPITKLEHKCEIISHEDDGTCFRVKFNYNDKDREFIYFHSQNFYTEWNQEIQDISHMMTIGATFVFNNEDADVSYTRKWPEIFKPTVQDDEICISEMIRTRINKDCIYYDGSDRGFNAPGFNESEVLKKHGPVRNQVFSHKISDVYGYLKLF